MINRILAIMNGMQPAQTETERQREEKVRGIAETMREEKSWRSVRKAIPERIACEVDAMLTRYMMGVAWSWNCYTLNVEHLQLRQCDLRILGTSAQCEEALKIANCVCLGFLTGQVS